jgi:hypothetical protein
MNKELLTIEFRYNDIPKGDYDSEHKSKTITIGVYDTLDEAIIAGNKCLELFEEYFKLNPHWNRKRRFGKNNGCFGHPNKLVTALGYLQTPFEFYAKIETLKYEDLQLTTLKVLEAGKRYKEYKLKEDE